MKKSPFYFLGALGALFLGLFSNWRKKDTPKERDSIPHKSSNIKEIWVDAPQESPSPVSQEENEIRSPDGSA